MRKFFGLISLVPALALGAVSADWDQMPQGKAWTDVTLKALDELGGSLFTMSVPADASVYCERFSQLDRDEKKAFFVQLISAMARYESSFRPATAYKESFTDAKGNRVVSRGLLQMSLESARSYGCPIKTAVELHDPEINLRCAVQALNKWIPTDGKLGSGSKGGARYWGVLRNSKAKKIHAKTRSLPFCQVRLAPQAPLPGGVRAR